MSTRYRLGTNIVYSRHVCLFFGCYMGASRKTSTHCATVAFDSGGLCRASLAELVELHAQLVHVPSFCSIWVGASSNQVSQGRVCKMRLV